MDPRLETIKELRMTGLTFKEIGARFSISRQRVQQILGGKQMKAPEDHKLLTYAKRRFLGLPDGKIELKSGGRDFLRELVRMRDNHTCQYPGCGRVWQKGQRRFDVHHLDEKIDEKIAGKIDSRRVPLKYDREHLDKLITFCHKCHFEWHREYKLKGLTLPSHNKYTK